MEANSTIFELYSSVLAYPSEETREAINNLQELLSLHYPESSELLKQFSEFTQRTSLTDWEEIYTRTFDVQSISTLDLGYALFGDDYKRGEVLVNLSKEHKTAGINCGTELADHLPNVLKLFAVLHEDEFKEELAQLLIIPALKKIISEFQVENIERKNKIYQKHHRAIIQDEKKDKLIYQSVLNSLLTILTGSYPESNNITEEHNSQKISFGNEMEVPE